MNSSRPQSAAQPFLPSLENSQGNLHLPIADLPLPGSFNDDQIIRQAITEAIRNCSKSREVIAEQMTYLLGTSVSKRALDSYTSEAAELHRFPAQYLRAFCHVTADWSALRCVSERSGYTVIGTDEQNLMELGREYLRQKRAAKNVATLEVRLEGVVL